MKRAICTEKHRLLRRALVLEVIVYIGLIRIGGIIRALSTRNKDIDGHFFSSGMDVILPNSLLHFLVIILTFDMKITNKYTG